MNELWYTVNPVNEIVKHTEELKFEGEKIKQLLIYKGNLTESELKAENAKTIEIKEHWENPNHKISSAITCDPNGIVYSNEEQTLPFTTLNNNGLQVFEETDDYIIYIDKDAVVTTVEQYVPGTYDLFLEERRAIENDVNRFRTWTSKDDSELLLKINDEQLKRIAETPVNMDEPSEIQTFTARAIPTTYECCFRTDKETGEVYIGEGYENYISELAYGKAGIVNLQIDGNSYTIEDDEKNGLFYHRFNIIIGTSKNKIKLDFNSSLSGSSFLELHWKCNKTTTSVSAPSTWYPLTVEKTESDGSFTKTTLSTENTEIKKKGFYFCDTEDINENVEFIINKNKSMVLRGHSTPKPFVRGVMPESKLALPNIEDLGEIVSKDGEVIQHENGTVIVDTPVYDDNMPDNRISMGIHVGANGEIIYKNNPNDPMPIKTRNMNGLQKWEETDDYIIYVDKDAVMTTVQNYVAGTYDLFLERKANIDGAIELLRENGIEWTVEDDSKLLQDINLAQLERIANTPTTMDEPTEIQTFEARTVPTTYECCFRTDKKSGEIYIGEGYENLWSFGIITPVSTVETVDGVTKIERTSTSQNMAVGVIDGINSELYKMSFYVTNIKTNTKFCITNLTDKENIIPTIELGYNEAKFSFSESEKFKRFLFSQKALDSEIGDFIEVKNVFLSKGEKPFVRGVMPAGKLVFVTNATSETHSFVGKDFYFTKPGSNNACRFMYDSLGQFLLENVKNETISNIYYSKDYRNVTKQTYNATTGMIRVYSYSQAIGYNDSFKQLLIYKGNLTESELKAENEKTIDLTHYNFQDNSIINKYGMKGFNKLMAYFPNLTAEEVAVEIGKKIRVDKLDFNPKSIKRYLSNLESFSGIKTYSQNLTESEILEEVSKELVPLFRNTGAIPNSSGEVKEIEARVKVPAIGGAFDDGKKAGIYSSFWIDKNEKSNKIGTRIAWKK